MFARLRCPDNKDLRVQHLILQLVASRDATASMMLPSGVRESIRQVTDSVESEIVSTTLESKVVLISIKNG